LDKEGERETATPQSRGLSDHPVAPTVSTEPQPRVTVAQLRATARGLAVWVFANSLAGGLVGVTIALFSGEPGAMARFVPMGILFANAIGFAAGLSARFILPRYWALPKYARFPLAVITLLAGGAFGSALVILFNPLTVFYQGRLILLLVIVDSIIAVIVGLIIFNYERLRDEIEAGYRALAENRVREERLRELATRSELKALRAQINPHFLFNALNSISALVSVDPEAAHATIERLAGVFRRTLLVSERESVPLGHELELVDAYLDIERARFGRRLVVQESVAPEARALPVPPLILQPVVENAIRHGVSPRVEGGTIRIEATVDGGRLILAVQDDGAGIEESRLKKIMSKGHGLRNVRERLSTRFGDGDWLVVRSEQGKGTRVELTIPVGP
jgi:sensor histidine kinase YesM